MNSLSNLSKKKKFLEKKSSLRLSDTLLERKFSLKHFQRISLQQKNSHQTYLDSKNTKKETKKLRQLKAMLTMDRLTQQAQVVLELQSTR